MGLTHVRVQVKKSRQSRKARTIEFLVDSGASYSLVDARTLRELAVEPTRRETFSLADNSKMTRRVGEAYFELNGLGATAPVIFGQRGDEPLLGVTALEAMGLVLDPYKRELRKARLMLACVKVACESEPQAQARACLRERRRLAQLPTRLRLGL